MFMVIVLIAFKGNLPRLTLDTISIGDTSANCHHKTEMAAELYR